MFFKRGIEWWPGLPGLDQAVLASGICGVANCDGQFNDDDDDDN